MKDDKELAAIIVQKLFECAGPHVERIQFMHREPGRDREQPGGGFGQKPLANFIEGVLKQYRSY